MEVRPAPAGTGRRLRRWCDDPPWGSGFPGADHEEDATTAWSRSRGESRMAVNIGRRMPRVDGREKVTAAVRYTEDLHVPGLLHARLLLSPHPHARIVHLDKGAALAVPGAVAVLLAEDLPIAEDATLEEHLLLASSEARYTGHPVAAVLAESEEAAADSVDALAGAVEYEVLPAVLDPEDAMGPESPLVNPHAGGGDGQAAGHAAVAVQ